MLLVWLVLRRKACILDACVYDGFHFGQNGCILKEGWLDDLEFGRKACILNACVFDGFHFGRNGCILNAGAFNGLELGRNGGILKVCVCSMVSFWTK